MDALAHITLGWPNMFLIGTDYFNCLYFNFVMERNDFLCIITHASNYLHQLRMASYVPNGNKLSYFQRRAKSK